MAKITKVQKFDLITNSTKRKRVKKQQLYTKKYD